LLPPLPLAGSLALHAGLHHHTLHPVHLLLGLVGVGQISQGPAVIRKYQVQGEERRIETKDSVVNLVKSFTILVS